MPFFPGRHSADTRIQLLLTLARTARQEDSAAIFTNFVAAALHLHHILNEIKLDGKKLPDLPDGKLGPELVKQWWYALVIITTSTKHILTVNSVSQTGEKNITADEVPQQDSEMEGYSDRQDKAKDRFQDDQASRDKEDDHTALGVVQDGQPDSNDFGQVPGINQTRPSLDLSNQDCEDVCKTIGDIDVSKLRTALQSAVYISPMLLLTDSKIYRWGWNQIDILKVRNIPSLINGGWRKSS